MNKTETLVIRLTKVEKSRIKKLAKLKNVKVSQLIRASLVRSKVGHMSIERIKSLSKYWIC